MRVKISGKIAVVVVLFPVAAVSFLVVVESYLVAAASFLVALFYTGALAVL